MSRMKKLAYALAFALGLTILSAPVTFLADTPAEAASQGPITLDINTIYNNSPWGVAVGTRRGYIFTTPAVGWFAPNYATYGEIESVYNGGDSCFKLYYSKFGSTDGVWHFYSTIRTPNYWKVLPFTAMWQVMGKNGRYSC